MYIYILYMYIYIIIANAQNICNLISQEECNIGRIVFSTSILYSETKKQQNNLLLRLQSKMKEN